MEAIFSSGLPGGSIVKNMPVEMQVQSLGQEDPLENETATHSNIISWRIPWTEEPEGLQSTAPQSWVQLSDYHLHFSSTNVL